MKGRLLIFFSLGINYDSVVLDTCLEWKHRDWGYDGESGDDGVATLCDKVMQRDVGHVRNIGAEGWTVVDGVLWV